MKKYLLLLVLLIALLTVGCSGGGSGSTTTARATGEKVKIRLVSCWAQNYELIHMDYFLMDQMKTMLGDQIEFQFFPAGELVKQKEVFDAVQNGVVEMGSDHPAYWAGKDSAFNIIASFPMWFDGIDFINWVYYGGGRAEIDRIYGQFDVVAIPFRVQTSESGPRSIKPIKSLADFKGLKMRISGKSQGAILNALGGSHVAISSAEVYQGLQRGLIDAAESSTPDMDIGLGYHEVTKYSSHPAWHQPGSLAMIIFNKKAWNSFPQHIKDCFEIAARATITESIAFCDYNSGIGTLKFREAGIKEYSLTTKELETINDLVLAEIYKEAAANPSFAKAALSMGEYLHMYKPWRELSYPYNHGWKDEKLPDLDRLRSYIK